MSKIYNQSRRRTILSKSQENYVQNADKIEHWVDEYGVISQFDIEFLKDFKDDIDLDLLFAWAINQDDLHLINKLSMVPKNLTYVTKDWFMRRSFRSPCSSLVLAIKYDKKNALDMLLQCGVNPNTPGLITGTTPLMFALKENKTDDKIPQHLIEAGADINAKCNKGWTALDYLYVNEIDFLYDNTNAYTILKQYLLDLGARPGAGASESKDKDYEQYDQWMG